MLMKRQQELQPSNDAQLEILVKKLTNPLWNVGVPVLCSFSSCQLPSDGYKYWLEFYTRRAIEKIIVGLKTGYHLFKTGIPYFK